jgi:hypothetical protein
MSGLGQGRNEVVVDVSAVERVGRPERTLYRHSWRPVGPMGKGRARRRSLTEMDSSRWPHCHRPLLGTG